MRQERDSEREREREWRSTSSNEATGGHLKRPTVTWPRTEDLPPRRRDAPRRKVFAGPAAAGARLVTELGAVRGVMCRRRVEIKFVADTRMAASCSDWETCCPADRRRRAGGCLSNRSPVKYKRRIQMTVARLVGNRNENEASSSSAVYRQLARRNATGKT